MSASKLQVTSDLAEAAVLLHRHNLITEEQGLALSRGIFNAAPSDEGYAPVFLVLMDDKEFFSTFGWIGDTFHAKPEHGAEAIKFMETRPKYNTCYRLENPGGWCICCRRGTDDVAIPRLRRDDAPKKRTTQEDSFPDPAPVTKAKAARAKAEAKKEKPEDDNPLMD